MNIKKIFKKVGQDNSRVSFFEDKKGEEEVENNFFDRLKRGLSKTHQILTTPIEDLISLGKAIDDEFFDRLEEILILSDMGVNATQMIISDLREYASREGIKDGGKVKEYLKERLVLMLMGHEKRLEIDERKPFVIMVVGVNGVGKTTTIGKLASRFKAQGKDVMLAACDTFRAAADEQLEIWGGRADVPVIKGKQGSDPSAVAFDSISSARARGTDVLIIDTAGRSHVKKNLMEELKKMKRVLGKSLEGAPNEVLLILDATTGQNAISQVRMFNEALRVTGVVLTKLDGTAKGGIIVAIAKDLDVPIGFVGVGEDLNSLQEFNASDFVAALFG